VGDSWIGGDLTGLHTMVTTLQPAPEGMRGVVAALSSGVDALVHDAGWSGNAANAFRRTWTADSVTAGTLSEVVSGVGDTLATLVVSLDILESAQREAARTAGSTGVSVEADGSVRPFVSAVPEGETTSPVVMAANTYMREVNGLREEAQQVRLQAQKDLVALLDQMLAEGPKASPDLYVTAADYLRGLLAVPNEGNRMLLSTYRERMATLQRARKDARAEIAATGAAAALQAKDDVEKGWSPAHAIAADVGAGVIGLGAGIGTAALIATAPVSVPTIAVAAAAGGVAVGVGDFAYQAFHEHWSEDIHDHGAVAGVFAGIGHSGERVGDDVGNMFSDIGHGTEHLGKSLWHGMFG
jgi:hypothetical protein